MADVIFKQAAKDKLVLALTADDVLKVVNDTLKTYNITLSLRYPKNAPAQLYLENGGLHRLWLVDNPKTKVPMSYPLMSPSFEDFANELMTLLKQCDAKIWLSSAKDPRTQKRVAKVQIFVTGSRGYAFTLLSAERGTTHADHEFTLE